MPKLILHAGTHKTGTTAIQTFAVNNRDALKSRGLLYPDYSPYKIALKDGHHQFAHSLAEASTARMSLDDVYTLIGHWRVLSLETGADLLVSVEALYRHQIGDGTTSERRRAFLHRVADALANFDVELVLVFRRPDNFARSLYQEHIASRTPRPRLPALSEWVFDPALFQMEYFESASIFREEFPNIRILIYEDLIEGAGLYKNFFRAIGFDTEGLPTSGQVRKSITTPQTVVKNYASDFLKDRRSSRRFMEWLQSREIETAVDEAFGGTRFDLWASHEERLAFLSSRAEDLERLRSTFFPDRERLFPPLRPGETLPPVPELPLEIQDLVDQYLRKEGLA